MANSHTRDCHLLLMRFYCNLPIVVIISGSAFKERHGMQPGPISGRVSVEWAKDLGHFWLGHIRMLGHLQLSAHLPNIERL